MQIVDFIFIVLCHSTDEWVMKTWNIYTMKYYPAIQRNQITNFAGKLIDPENILLIEITQRER